MYVAPACRGTGLARRILAELEAIAREHGCRAVRLDTSAYLTAAVALYRAAGYHEVPAYNGNPKADLWFERERLGRRLLAVAVPAAQRRARGRSGRRGRGSRSGGGSRRVSRCRSRRPRRPARPPRPARPVDRGRAGHVGVEVAAVLAFAVDQQVVAVEDRVVAGAQHPAVAHRDQRRAAGGDDVEALVGAAAAARRAEFADRAAGPVRALDREDVAVEGDAAVAAGDLRPRPGRPGRASRTRARRAGRFSGAR